MKILMTGATGFVGVKLVKALLREGHTIHLLTRDVNKSHSLFQSENVKAFSWPDYEQAPPAESLNGISGIIHLMGENIAAKRWSDQQKKILQTSRIDSTHSLSKAITDAGTKLDFFISSSAVGIYPTNREAELTEDSGPGKGFLASLCLDWEKALAEVPNTRRKVAVRTGVVLDHGGGALAKMIVPFKLGLGGPIGDGYQMMSWIHRDDLVNIYIEAVKNPEISGAINAVAPAPVDNFTFTKSLGRALHRPTLFPVPEAALKVMFGEMSGVILDSQKVIPAKLMKSGFKFFYPDIDSCLKAIVQAEKQ